MINKKEDCFDLNRYETFMKTFHYRYIGAPLLEFDDYKFNFQTQFGEHVADFLVSKN